MLSVLTHSAQDYFTPKLLMTAKCLLLFCILSLMISVLVINHLSWIAAGCVLLSASGLNWRSALNNKVILAGLLLILLFTISLIYSHASTHMALRCWNKYLKIFYLLLFLPLFFEKKMRVYAIHCLIASVMLSEIFSYLHYFSIYTFAEYSPVKHWLFVQDLDASFIVSYVCFLLANLACDHKKFRWLYLSFFVVCSFDILFLNVERTGYIIYLSLTGLFLLQRFKWKGLLSACLCLPLVVGTLYFTSHTFNNRIHQVINNVSDYHQGRQSTSIGLRLNFAKYSFKMLEGHWLNGIGVGSFQETYRVLGGPKMEDGTDPTQPHDEYINILVQIGLIGLVTYLTWVLLQVRASFALPTAEKFFLQGLILGFGILSFCNASLFVNPAGAVYVLFLAVFLAAKQKMEQ